MAGLADLFTLSLSTLGIAETVDDPAATNHTASTLRKFWPMARDQVLRDFPWACVRKSRVLSLHEQDIPGWKYCYNYPTDCILALAVMPESGLRSRTLWRDCWENHQAHRPQRYPFERQLRDDNTGQVIATDLESAYLLYIARVENPAVYDVGLFSTAAARLAVLSGPTFKVKPDMLQRAENFYAVERSTAAANDLNECEPDQEPTTPSLVARE